MITLTLSVAEAATLLDIVGPAYTGYAGDGEFHPSMTDAERSIMEAEQALKTRLNAELVEAVIAAGGPESVMINVGRMHQEAYTLAASEDARNRPVAADKLYVLGDAMGDVRYAGLDEVRKAYADLGAQTKAKLSPELTALLSSL